MQDPASHASPTWTAPLDLIGLGLIAVLLLLGLYRGLWWQVIRLVGVAVSVLVARAAGAPLAQRLMALFSELEPRSAHGLAWGTLFLTTLLACALLGMAGQRMLEAMKLDFANRFAGACAGAATGLFLHVVLVVLVCQLAPERMLGKYVAGTYSERLYTTLGIRRPVVLAAEATQDVDRILGAAPRRKARSKAVPEPPPRAQPPQSKQPSGVR
ncbi:MAG: hypothetical protein HOP15_12845 [Planctomycetes bacterium]|nr:hypothetical protein [Planctomycetota bacterium]